MTYRAEYGYVGQNKGKALSLAPTERMGGKFMWEWKLPFVTPKVELSRLTNNVDHDPTRNQTIATRQQYSLDWTIPDWPRLMLTYGREQKDIFTRPEESRSDATLMERVTAKIAIDRPLGGGEWSSRYTTFQNDIHNHGTREELHSMMKGRLYLIKPIDISPSIGFAQQTNVKQDFSQNRLYANLETSIRLSTEHTIQPSFKWTRIGTQDQPLVSETLFSKLQYTYDLADQGYYLAIIGQYALSQTSRQDNNPQSYDMSLFVQKDLHNLIDLPHQQQFISLKLTHNQKVSALSSQLQRSDSTAMLLLRVTS